MIAAPAMTVEQLIAALHLAPHPEGGFFREIYRAPSDDGERGVVTSIYFLLPAGVRSHWHRVDAVEIWNYHAGAALNLYTAETDRGPVTTHRLGPDIGAGEVPQGIVEKDHWQAAQSLGDWTLMGCQVAPAFQFDGFEMAEPDWTPG